MKGVQWQRGRGHPRTGVPPERGSVKRGTVFAREALTAPWQINGIGGVISSFPVTARAQIGPVYGEAKCAGGCGVSKQINHPGGAQRCW